MVPIPERFLDLIGVSATGEIAVGVEGDRLVMQRIGSRRPRYTLDELVAESEPGPQPSEEDRDWLAGRPMGSELI